MKLSLKDLIVIAAVTVLSFPLMYFGMMFATGNARIELNPKAVGIDPEKREEVTLMRTTLRRDSLAAAHAESFHAMQRQMDSLKRATELLEEQEKRSVLVKQELEQTKQALETERKLLEQAVASNEDASKKKMRQLAQLYGAMRPAEVAQILETLKDDLVISILQNIGDDRQKGKIMGALSKDKAARISTKMAKVGQ